MTSLYLQIGTRPRSLEVPVCTRGVPPGLRRARGRGRVVGALVGAGAVAYPLAMKRFLFAAALAVVLAAPAGVHAAPGGAQKPVAKSTVAKKQAAKAKKAARSGRAAHGDGQCPFAKSPAI